MSQVQIQQIIELIQSKNIGTRDKSAWIDRLQVMSPEQLEDLYQVLNARTREELEALQQKNIHKLNGYLGDLKDLTQKGIKLIYQKGEEASRQKEVAEQSAVLQALENV